MNKIIYAATAEQDLTNIAFAIYELSKDIDTAIEFVHSIRKTVSRLDKFPLSGKPVEDRHLADYGYRYVIEGVYLAFYTVCDQTHTVQIEAILNGKTDYIKKLINRITE